MSGKSSGAERQLALELATAILVVNKLARLYQVTPLEITSLTWDYSGNTAYSYKQRHVVVVEYDSG